MSTTLQRDRVRGSDALRLYLAEIGRYELLAKHDEARLGKVIQRGRAASEELARLDGHHPADGGHRSGRGVGAQPRSLPTSSAQLRQEVEDGRLAAQVFLRANLRLVVSIAKRYRREGVDFEDLVQEGNLGLLRAVERFDWERGFKFSTYATWWIRQAISKAASDSGHVMRVPSSVSLDSARLRIAYEQLEQGLHRIPQTEEIATAAGISAERVRHILSWGTKAVSLDAPAGPDGAQDMSDLIADPGAVDPQAAAVESLLPEEVSKLLAKLDPREREILSMHFGLGASVPRSLEQLSEHFGLSAERLRQLEARAFAKLRDVTAGRGPRSAG